MNLADLMNSSFGAADAARLGQAVGLEAADATRVLHAALPSQLAALAEHSRTAQGRDQIAQAVRNLPAFASAGDALSGPEGASTLESAGKLLAPALLGERASGLAAQVAGGLDTGRVERLLHLALPLLLSVLGQRGLRDGDVAALLPGPAGKGESAAPARVVLSASPAAVSAAPGTGTVPAAPDDAGPAGLLDSLRGPFGGAVAERLGTAAGFSGGAAVRATGAALPVLLAALARKGGSEAGAADLLARSQGAGAWISADGRLDASRLSDPAEVARLEGQGRPLLGTLFGNVDEVTGRLGSAIGGSGTSAGRLLALLAPLVLGLLGQRAAATGLKPAGLAGLLAGLPGGLAAILPAGMPGLGALLDRVGREPVAVATAAPQVRTVPAPRPAAPPAASPVPAAPREAPARRRGLAWWLLPLLLLLGLGGCWLLQSRPETAPAATGAADGATPAPNANGITVTTPASGASLPAAPLTLSGTAPAGETLTVSEGGEPLATVTVQQDGRWSAELPAPAPGPHTYTVSASGGANRDLTLDVAGAGARTPDGSGAADAAAPADEAGAGAVAGATGAFAIAEPAPNAQLPAGGFTLRGTGTPGQTVQLLEDGTSLGSLTINEDGTWSQDVPSPEAGEHTYSVQAGDGTELGRVTATVAAAAARTDSCRDDYTLSISDGQTVGQPFRFGGVGQGEGYRVTVKRGDRVVGTRSVPLDNTCGWSYQSRPGAGKLTYEVRPLGDAAAEPLSVVTLTVTN
ncbi:DUF937 domain-containing protein [Deinococcus budaensis]|uniref:DUF937 domain-containing protein n=1 Tax=Deinococcus budaensis TaxID=1665626 RepID=A0A7W8LQM5_9DEIO|nr:DUF937 domain-containing protein [Deinococcus budaensis]MBB5235023.1 hypothetical protein [Deinococcus budaensis]